MSNGVICAASNACLFFDSVIPTLPLYYATNNPSLKYFSADANNSNLMHRGSLVLVSILLYLRPSRNTMQTMGFFMTTKEELRTGLPLSSPGYPNSPLYQRLRGEPFLFPCHPMPNFYLLIRKTDFLPNKEKAEV